MRKKQDGFKMRVKEIVQPRGETDLKRIFMHLKQKQKEYTV
jgi:hypothetical protein